MLARTKESHVWQREPGEHYVENRWCSRRLFDVEPFTGSIQDPCCGWGRVVEAGIAAGHAIFGTDIVHRGFADQRSQHDFMTQRARVANVAGNPPFDIFQEFADQALRLSDRKVALIWQTPRLNAASWLKHTPLVRVWFLTPRPSMPPGRVVEELLIGLADAECSAEPKGGTQDYCWLVWDHKHKGAPTFDWLHRDRAA